MPKLSDTMEEGKVRRPRRRLSAALLAAGPEQADEQPGLLAFHYRRAEAASVTPKQLATLSVWRDTQLFDEREQAALRLAEITTTLPDRDTAEREYARARAVLTDDELSAVVWIATAINAFNRVAILSGHTVRP